MHGGRTIGEGWENVVFINWMRVPIPASLLNLGQADVSELIERGPLTRSYDMVYPLIAVHTVAPLPPYPDPES